MKRGLRAATLLLLSATYVIRVVAADTGPVALSRIEALSGDRQIVVTNRSGLTSPSTPYRVRALDSSGKPVAGVLINIQRNGAACNVALPDEFGWTGFNDQGPPNFCLVDERFPTLVTTDPAGVASAGWPLLGNTRSSSLIVTGSQSTGDTTLTVPAPALFSTVAVLITPPGNPSVIVEYFHEPTHHYFNTIDDNEIAALDAGKLAGWKRSVGSFIGYKSAQAAPTGAVPVCRFFSPQFTSHFLTASQAECNAVIARYPAVWQLETREAFYINVPDETVGACAPGFQAVYRLFNNKPGGNHRYVTDRALRDRMVREGWLAEGVGPDAIAMCTPG